METDSTDEDDSTSHPRLCIREAEIDDLAEIYHIGESLFTSKDLPVLYRTWEPYEVTSYYNSDPELCLVASDDEDNIVGFALASTVDKDGSPWRYGYLAWLGVKQEYQGQRVAQRLLRELEKRMKQEGVRILLVDTEGDNFRALDFFKKHGFNHPSAHIWLTKSLSPRKSKSAAANGSQGVAPQHVAPVGLSVKFRTGAPALGREATGKAPLASTRRGVLAARAAAPAPEAGGGCQRHQGDGAPDE